MTMGTPPGYALFFPVEPTPAAVIRRLAGDGLVERWRSVSGQAKQELADYYAALHAGRGVDRVRQELHCLWFDVPTRRCRHYEDRPPVCREFEVGGEGCLGWREEFGINSPHAEPAAAKPKRPTRRNRR
jgi:Fe-S-cluster containining protein